MTDEDMQQAYDDVEFLQGDRPEISNRELVNKAVASGQLFVAIQALRPLGQTPIQEQLTEEELSIVANAVDVLESACRRTTS